MEESGCVPSSCYLPEVVYQHKHVTCEFIFAMLSMFSPVSLEAQKLISVSIGKINASRVTRTGTSLHRSLLVASVLHKARNVYLEEERERASRFCPSPELTVTPVCQNVSNTCENSQNIVQDNRLLCLEDEVVTPDIGEESKLPLSEANTENNVTSTTTNTTTTVTAVTNTSTVTTTSNNSRIRKRRRVSDQETAAAISSILPKRLRSELKEDPSPCSSENIADSNSLECDRLQSSDNVSGSSHPSTKESPSFESSSRLEEEETRVPSPDSANTSASDDSDSDSDDAVSDTSTQ